MLKRFFLNTLSSFVGTWLALGLFGLSAFLLIFALLGKMSMFSTENIEPNSILEIRLDGSIIEREKNGAPNLLKLMQGSLELPQNLEDIVEAIKEASENDDIRAIYLNCGNPDAGGATLDAIRHELLEFKKNTAGRKKIIAYGEGYSQGSYFVASVADEIYMNPAGELNLHGMSASNLYMKDLFDKLGVEFQVVKVGTYKSAVEPYIMQNMSEPARAQLDTLLTSMWDYTKKEISASRSAVSTAAIDSLVNIANISFAPSESAVKCGLVDKLAYYREIRSRLAELAGVEEEKLNIISPNVLVGSSRVKKDSNSDNQIAVLYLEGEIADGNNEEINYQKVVPQVLKLAEDENVKGLVVRVNSPGGSVYGSTQIGEAFDYFQSKGKVLTVSMGDYAASGGYWISAKANKIYADPLTITGSIGIFGLIPNFKGTLDKIGVNVETVSTNPSANFPGVLKPMDEQQLSVMQKYVERGYDQFTTRVAEGRKMSKQEVLKIAEGRVWSASSAKKIGLIDELGYLNQAIEWTAKQSKLGTDYQVVSYPKLEDNFWSILQSDASGMSGLLALTQNQSKEEILKQWLIKKILSRKHIQALMPEIKVNL